MNAQETLTQLEALGTEQNRKIYARHGVKGQQFGVSFTALRKLAKQIGKDTDKAELLWRSGNHDARVLACMLADPEKLGEDQVERWASDLDNYIVADSFAGLISQSPFARLKAEGWINASNEWVSSAGWNLVSGLAMHAEKLDDGYFLRLLEKIESSIDSSPNRTRYNMNNALIAIGIRNEKLRVEAEAAARRIGKVKVEHGETSCKTPNAVETIHKTMAYRERKIKA